MDMSQVVNAVAVGGTTTNIAAMWTSKQGLVDSADSKAAVLLLFDLKDKDPRYVVLLSRFTYKGSTIYFKGVKAITMSTSTASNTLRFCAVLETSNDASTISIVFFEENDGLKLNITPHKYTSFKSPIISLYNRNGVLLQGEGL